MTSIAARILFAATVLALCVPPIGSLARADVVAECDVIALNATTIPPNSALHSRTIAIVDAASYDVAIAVERNIGAYAVGLNAVPGTSLVADLFAGSSRRTGTDRSGEAPGARHRAQCDARQRFPTVPIVRCVLIGDPVAARTVALAAAMNRIPGRIHANIGRAVTSSLQGRPSCRSGGT